MDTIGILLKGKKMTNELKGFWEEMHKTNNLRLLSNTKGIYIWKNLQIEKRIIKGNRVLNIGVGTGRGTKDLYDTGMIVDVMDISDIPLYKVEKYCQFLYLFPDNLPMYDVEYNLIISHLVIQHMNDKDILKQFKAVMSCLKDDGIMAIQFADVPNKIEANRQRLTAVKAGGVLRTPEEMTTLINKAGGEVIWMSNKHTFKHTKAVWYFAHIRRRK